MQCYAMVKVMGMWMVVAVATVMVMMVMMRMVRLIVIISLIMMHVDEACWCVFMHDDAWCCMMMEVASWRPWSAAVAPILRSIL